MTRLLGGLILSLAVTLVATGFSAGADDKNAKEAQKAIIDLSKMIESGKDAKAVAAEVAAIKKKFDDLDTVMTVFKLKKKDGLGYDNDPDMGLEKKIQQMDSRQMSATTIGRLIKKEEGQLLKLAYVSIAMADLAKPYFHKAEKGKTEKDWYKHCDDQKKAAQDLIKAVKANDGKAAKAAFKALNESCLNCHTDFRLTN